MTIHQSYDDAGQGSPNLEGMQYLQENWARTEINAALRVDKVSVASGSAGIDASVPVGAEIIDVVVVCTGSNGSGSMTVKDADDNDITDAITCATDKAVTRAGTIDDAYRVVPTDGVKVVANADGDKGDVYIHYIQVASSS